MITDELIAAINRGREGKAQGYSIGLPKLEQVIDGVCKKTYYLITAESGVGKSSLMLYSFIYRPLFTRASLGRSASSGIAQYDPIFIAPGILPSEQRSLIHLGERFHFSDVCLIDK